MSDEPEIEIPHDTVNEQILIAAALVNDASRANLLRRVGSDLFVDDQHRAVWKAMEELARKKVAFSMPTLHAEVSATVGLPYLRNLVTQYPTPPAAIEHHVDSLKWDHARASAVQGPLGELLRGLRDPATTPATIRSAAKHVGQSFDVKTGKGFMRDPSALAKDALADLKARQTMGVYPMGIRELDWDKAAGQHRLVPGAAPGKTTLVTGVSGSGKSILGCMFALEQARMKRQVLFGAWEMGSEETIMLMAAMSCGFNRYDLTTGQLDATQLAKLERTMLGIGKYVKFFDAPFSADLRKKYGNDEALDVLSQQINDSGCAVFIADLWERCIPDGDPGAERRALFRQQQIAKETRCHQILLCQQKLKEIEKRPDKRPTRSTILGSSAWVDIADTILGCHRPQLWDQSAQDTMEVSILKQRFGKWPLVVEFDWDGNAMTLANGREIDYEDPLAAGREDIFGGKR